MEVQRNTEGGKDLRRIQDLSTDERCSQAVLDFLATMDVGRRVPNPAEEDAQSDRELREQKERGEEMRLEAEEARAEGEERLQFFPTPSFIASAEEA